MNIDPSKHCIKCDRPFNSEYAAISVCDCGDSESPLDKQVGGTHYKDLAIQPVEFCQKNRFGYCESAAIKYISRHKGKGQAEDIRKAIHYLELLLEIEYKEAK